MCVCVCVCVCVSLDMLDGSLILDWLCNNDLKKGIH